MIDKINVSDGSFYVSDRFDLVVLTITPEILRDAERIRKMGANKIALTKLYREEWLSMKEIAKRLSEDLEETVTLKHVNGLFELHKIQKWNEIERRSAATYRPASSSGTEKKIAELKALGFDKSKFESLYHDENLTKNEIIRSVNEQTGVPTVNKGWMKRIFEYYEIFEKSKDLTYKRRSEITAAVCMEKFGVPNGMQDQSVKDKARAGILKSGGFTLQKSEHRIKISESSNTPEARAKRNATNLARYGTINPQNNEKARKTRILNYIEEELNHKESRETLETMSLDALLDLTNGIGENPSHRSSVIAKIAKSLETAVINPRSRSKGERELEAYVRSITDYHVKHSDRTLISPQEVDIYIAELGLAIEYNGDYFHCDKVILERLGITGKQYHEAKRYLCAAKGVELLFVWESDWKDHRKQVEEAIVNAITSDLQKIDKIFLKMTSPLVR